ncbi:hypothetical protein GN156_04070 [bacterium LRH843]|nr:hypothetical protein [bacterium LRH843]
MKHNIDFISYPKDFIECNHHDEYEELSEYQKNQLELWIMEYIFPHQIKSYSAYHSSYSLKHKFQNSGVGFYVTNGAFKGAMLASGIKPKDKNRVNWTFKLGKKAGSVTNKRIPTT